MSGRSAYVRKEKVTSAAKHSNTYYPSSNQSSFIPAGPPTVAYNVPSGRPRGSFSSAERGPMVPHPYGYAAEQPSRIEKSTFRSFLDRKSDAFRAKLASPFADKSGAVRTQGGGVTSQPNGFSGSSWSSAAPQGDPYANMPRSSAGRALPSAYDGPQWQDFKPPTARPEQTRAHPSATQTYDYARRRNNTFDFGDAMRLVRRYEGSGKTPQPWNRLQKDPELWDYKGDTLVYLGSETEGASRPAPSFRIHSSFLEETESPFFRTILREGRMEFGQDYDHPQNTGHYSRDPSGLTLPVHGAGRDSRSDTTSQVSYGKSQGMSSRMLTSRLDGTPPQSDLDTAGGNFPASYEIYFPAPSDLSRPETLRYHLTTRNVFALLIHKSLVGTSLGQTLKDLHERMEMYMPEDFDTTSLLIDYVVVKGLDDVRNDASAAAGLMIWSETPGVNWVEAWREAYVTCVALYPRIKNSPEVRAISAISRALMERANLELSVRIQHAEDRLIAFEFSDMWPTSSISDSPSREAFDKFGKFLLNHYNTAFWSWPPPGLVQNGQWLNRDTAMRLRKDFGALYDYLVDRDVTWDDSEATNGRPRLVKQGFERNTFRADTDDLPMTEILLGFDRRHRYPNIPRPFPLQPDSIAISPSMKTKKPSKREKSTDMRTHERRVAMAYSEATNLYILGSGYTSNELVEAFVQFEKTDNVMETNPLEARRGRWILLYGILQTLATIAVDTPGLRWTEDVPYFLCPRLKGTPPWRTRNEENFDEASHENSYCWTVSKEWPGRATPRSVGSADPEKAGPQRKASKASENARSRAERLMPNTPDHIQKVNNMIGSKRFQSDYIGGTMRKSEDEREQDEQQWARELERQRNRAETSSRDQSRAGTRGDERSTVSSQRGEVRGRLRTADDISADHRWRLDELERAQRGGPLSLSNSGSHSPPIEAGPSLNQPIPAVDGNQTTETDWKELRKQQARERLSKDLMKSGAQRQHQATNMAVDRMHVLGEEIENMRFKEAAHQDGLASLAAEHGQGDRRKPDAPPIPGRSQGRRAVPSGVGSVDSLETSASYITAAPRMSNNEQGRSTNYSHVAYGNGGETFTALEEEDGYEPVSREASAHGIADQRGQRDVSITPPLSRSGYTSSPSAQATSYTTVSSSGPPNHGKQYYPYASSQANEQAPPLPRKPSNGQLANWRTTSQSAGSESSRGHHISEMMSSNERLENQRAYEM